MRIEEHPFIRSIFSVNISVTQRMSVGSMTSDITTIIDNEEGKVTSVKLWNVSSDVAVCPAHFLIILCNTHGTLPRDEGCVKVNSAKYHGWQILAYEVVMAKTILQSEHLTFENCYLNNTLQSNLTPVHSLRWSYADL